MRMLGRWCIVLLVLISGMVVSAQDEESPYVGVIPAPDFPAEVDWVNSDPIALSSLQGKIVVLDFWTYGCINCIHMIPVLRQLEEKYANEVVVIGVHSAKFGPAEGETENIEQIVARYDIDHPVVNDKDFTVWRSYRIQAWPTFAIIDPRGNIVAEQSGEIPFEAFDQYISGMIAYYDGLGDVLNRTPLENLVKDTAGPSSLFSFPGKVLVDADSNRLFVADSDHNRIVVIDLATGEATDVIGSGARGLQDGVYAEAQFNVPQGMALRENMLYVADTNNHAIRTIDLEAKTVATIAGGGDMGNGLMPFDTLISDPLGFDLRSPWDLAFDAEGLLYIAMAGTHQVWQFNLTENTMKPFVGSGREAQKGGAFARAELAQPSGLYYDGTTLYIADAESSTIRAATFETQDVAVIAGTTDNNLFDFGDVDGALGANRLQHALGVTGDENGILYFADTYNNKIKRYDPATQETTTLAGLGGTGGYRDGAADVAQFDEPGGLTYADGTLYVADTNNHAIRLIDVASGTVSTLQIANPTLLQQSDQAVTVIGGNAASGDVLALPETPVKAGEGEIVLTYEIPEGFKLNPLAVSTVEVKSAEEGAAFDAEVYTIDALTTTIPLTLSAGTAAISLEATLFYCEAEQEAFCLVDVVTISGPVTVTEDAETSTLSVTRIATPPEAYEMGGLGD